MMIKKINLLFLIVWMSFVNAQTNLVQNAGFETGDTTSWTLGPTSGYTLPAIANNDKKTGSYSAQYNAVAATTGFYQEMPATAGKTYTVSFWYKASGDGTDARIWSVWKDAASLQVYQNNTVGSDPLRGPNNVYLTPATVWTQYTVDVVAPANIVTFQFAIKAYSGATVAYFDDFYFADKILAVKDMNLSKHALVKNTQVIDKLIFATKANISISDSTGRVVKSASVEKDSFVDLSSLPKGIYFVKGIANGEQSIQKIIKQ